MALLACWSCGRSLDAVASLESLRSEERRCPRCGAHLERRRLDGERRAVIRRDDPTVDPGPPGDADERPTGGRREMQRRGSAGEGR